MQLDTRDLEEHERSTVPSDSGLRASRREAWARRAILAVLAAIVLAGISNVLGMRTDTVAAESGDLAAELAYPDRGRGGLAFRWELTVRHEGGFTEPIVVRTDTDYLLALDFNAIYPEPAETTSEGDMVTWEFDQPEGDVITISIDGRIEPSRQSPVRGVTIVEAEGATVTLRYRTWLSP